VPGLPALPVPFIAVVPVKVRFSTLADRVVVAAAVRVSVMVVVTVLVVPKLALVEEDRVKVKVSLASLMASLRIGILMS
jgi:hypothetical protein